MEAISIEALTDHLKYLREKSGMTLQEVALASNIPLPTVKRVFAGQTEAPGFQTVCDLIRVMGGSLDTLLGMKPHIDGLPRSDDPLIQRLEASHAETIRVYRESILSFKTDNERKQKWLLALFVTSLVLVAVIVGVMFYDLTHTGVGFFR